MKKYLSIAVLALISLNIHAQTNSLTATNEISEYGKYDVTVSSAGSHYGNNNQAGVDFSVSSNPFEKVAPLWVGISQSLYWEPSFGGSTDINADWNVNITDKICILGGWSLGDVYGAGVDNLIRTGPELIGQYYLSDDAYLYGGINYDLLTHQNGNWNGSNESNNGFRWSIGIGVEF